MSWKNTGLILAGMAVLGTSIELYKRQYILPQAQTAQAVQVKEKKPVTVSLPTVYSLQDLYKDTDYQALARVILSETDGIGLSIDKVAEATWNRYLEKRDGTESLADFVYNQPNVFKAIHKRDAHFDPVKNYDKQTRHRVLHISYNQVQRTDSTGPDHFDHIKVPVALSINDVQKYANHSQNLYFNTPSWMEKGTIKAHPHSQKHIGTKTVLLTSDNF